MKTTSIKIFVLTLLTSCSFNIVFLKPTKMPVGVKKVAVKTASDTTFVHFSGDKYQPSFLKNDKDTLDPGFTIESVVYKSSNGHTLNGWFLKPKDKQAKITILCLHGNSGFLLNQYQTMSPLVKYGFQIFLFDYSGFGFSQGRATKDNAFTDAMSSINYLKNREDVKNTKFVLYGQALGGHLSAVVGTECQNNIDALVIEGAFSSNKDIAAYNFPIIGRIFVKQGYRATKSIRSFHKPLLVIHSTEDEKIPFYMGKKIFEAANAPKEFFEIKKCNMCGPEFYGDAISYKIKGMLTTVK